MTLEIINLSSSLTVPRIINGLWQVAGAHGPIDPNVALLEMKQYHDAGLYAWDMADIYGPAENLYGQFLQLLEPSSQSVGFTKFVPSPGHMTKSLVTSCIDRSLLRMNVDAIDLLQFHWWDYGDREYSNAIRNLADLTEDGKIMNLGLTNFDTAHLNEFLDIGIKIITNQVQFSVLDDRPEVSMIPFCTEHNIKLLCYGVLLGGFLSEKYLHTPEPQEHQLNTASLQKYKNMIDVWGGWSLFQELLSVMHKVAKKHDASIANVAVRYILDKPSVGAVIIGTRLGISKHIEDNLRTLKLDEEDVSTIRNVASKGNNLYKVIGDCGDEYRH